MQTPTSFSDIKAFHKKSLERRANKNLPTEVAAPSEMWEFSASAFRYVYTLDDDELLNIRRHTYHLTNDSYIKYALFSERFRGQCLKEYTELARVLGVWPTEGDYGVGFDFGSVAAGKANLSRFQGKLPTIDNGRSGSVRVSSDQIRYMQVCDDLMDGGLLQADTATRIVEIGGGYGGLAAVIAQINPNVSYTIIDLEDTQFFQAINLATRFGFDRLRLCLDGVKPGAVEPGLFYLVPQHVAESICCNTYDFAINQQSMQEMTRDQVIRYCRIINESCKKFYSCNIDHHSQRFSAEIGLIQHLGRLQAELFGEPLWMRDKPRGLKRWMQRIVRTEKKLSDVDLPRRVFQCQATSSAPVMPELKKAA